MINQIQHTSRIALRSTLHAPRSGFTLIEMLIVVAVIAILSSAVLVGLGPVQRQGRDSRRIGDLRSVQNGLELYFTKCGYYPGGTQGGATCSAFSGAPSDWLALSNAITGSNIGVNRIPNDPTSGKNYVYGADGSGSSYVVGAILEDVNNPALTTGDDTDGVIFGVNCADPVYCIQF